MTAENTRREFPMWAMAERITEEEKQESKRAALLTEKFENFRKKHTVTIIGAVLLTVWTVGTCCITGSIVKHNTEAEVSEELTHNWRGQMQIVQDRVNILESIVQKRNAGNVLTEEERSVFKEITGEGILTGEESRQAAMEADADWLARLAGPYATKRMQETVIWNALVRVASPNYPNTVEGVVTQKDQWMFFSETNPIKEDVRELAMEQLELFQEGRYPAGLSNEFVYGEWSSTDYVLRDRWEKNSSTKYWRMPE